MHDTSLMVSLLTIVVVFSTHNSSAKTVLSLRDKKQKVIAIYLFIAMIFFTIIAVGTSFVIRNIFFNCLCCIMSPDIVQIQFSS